VLSKKKKKNRESTRQQNVEKRETDLVDKKGVGTRRGRGNYVRGVRERCKGNLSKSDEVIPAKGTKNLARQTTVGRQVSKKTSADRTRHDTCGGN